MKDKKLFIGIIIGVLITLPLSIKGVTTLYTAEEVSYDNSNSGTTNDNVQDTIDELYSKVNVGDATAEDILSGKTALVKGKLINGTYSGDNYNIKYAELFSSMGSYRYTIRNTNGTTSYSGIKRYYTATSDCKFILFLNCSSGSGSCGIPSASKGTVVYSANTAGTGYNTVAVVEGELSEGETISWSNSATAWDTAVLLINN